MDRRNKILAGASVGFGAILIASIIGIAHNISGRDPKPENMPVAPPAIVAVTPDASMAAPPPDAFVQPSDKQRRAAGFAALIGVDSVEINLGAPAKITVPDVDGKCDFHRLLKMRAKAKAAHFDLADFDKLECAGSLGDEIDLHTETGCSPDQWDVMILTDAGRQRDAWSEELSKLTFANYGVVVIATGCDATLLTVASMEGGGCTEEKMQGLVDGIRKVLKQHGFKTASCAPGNQPIQI